MKDLNNLKNRYLSFKENFPHTMIRNAAKELGVSEMQLLELELGSGAIRLQGNWKNLISKITDIGYVVALTRNDFAIYESRGIYKDITFTDNQNIGIVIGPKIDLRLFINHWKYAYAVKRNIQNKASYSLHFFDEYGDAIHKIFTLKESSSQAFYNILIEYKSNNQRGITSLSIKRDIISNRLDELVDKDNFKKEWLQLSENNNFYTLLKKYKLNRQQALRLAPRGYTHQINPEILEDILQAASRNKISLTIHVHNKGCIQIHTGKINRIMRKNEWLKIVDSSFNLHLNTYGVNNLWVVRKPTKDGIVSSLELFNKKGESIMYCMGEKKLGFPESTAWRNLVNQMT